jgi:predicted peptidase
MKNWKSISKLSFKLAAPLALMLAATVLPLADAYAAASGRQEPQSLTKEIRKTVTINYLLYLPKQYEEDKGKRWPLILFLHGAGERGSDLNKLKAYGPPKLVSEGKEMPFIIVSPQASVGSTWDPDALNALLDEIVDKYSVDEDRIYLTGVSMGGAGTWRLAAAHPERFAAIAPICGWGAPGMAQRIGSIPTWVFHGARDDIVPLQASQEMVDALKQVGNEAKFTIYPDAGHDSWTPTYNNPAIFEWLLTHKRGAASASGVR